jgi:transcriptional regulator with XRE-family HTH domain
MANRLGEKLRGLRKATPGMTLDKLASSAGMSKSYLWELENREAPARPSAEKLAALAAVFGVTTDYFLSQDLSEPLDEHLDSGFFREYLMLENSDKAQLRRILRTFKKGP